MNYLPKLLRLRTIRCCLIIALLGLSMQACVRHQYSSKPVSTVTVLNVINSWSVQNPDLNNFLKVNGVPEERLQTNVFSIKRLYLTGLFYDPEMQVAYKGWRKAKIVTEHSHYNINPELSIPFEHHSDTSDGQSEWTIGAVLSFIYEHKGKREARLAKANVNLLNAKLAISRLAFERYGNFEEHYHHYVVSRAKVTETKNEIKALKQLLEQLQNKYELGAVSQFELSTIKLELQRRVFQLSLQENSLQENKDDLLAMTQLVYSELDGIEIEYIHPFAFTNNAYQNTELLGANFFSLQRSMLENHLQMAIQLK